MSIKFLGYMFPKSKLWQVTTTTRDYLHAAHNYAFVAQLTALAEWRLRQKPEGEQHAKRCGVNYLGTCTCPHDGWRHMRKVVMPWITDHDPDLHGIEGMCVEFKRRGEYLMTLKGEIWWRGLDEPLVEHLGLREIHYNDGADVPDEDRPNLALVDHFYEQVELGRCFYVPLLTTDQLMRIYWHLAWGLHAPERARRLAEAEAKQV